MGTTGRWPVGTEAEVRSAVTATFGEVSRYASRLAGPDRGLAEDVVQDVYLAVVRAARSRELTEVGLGWLMTATRHRFLDQIRRRHRTADAVERLAAQAVGGATDDTPTPDGDLVRGLSSVERAVLVLHHVEERPVREVAGLIGRSVPATEALLVRARRVAKAAWEREVDRG